MKGFIGCPVCSTQSASQRINVALSSVAFRETRVVPCSFSLSPTTTLAVQNTADPDHTLVAHNFFFSSSKDTLQQGTRIGNDLVCASHFLSRQQNIALEQVKNRSSSLRERKHMAGPTKQVRVFASLRDGGEVGVSLLKCEFKSVCQQWELGRWGQLGSKIWENRVGFCHSLRSDPCAPRLSTPRCCHQWKTSFWHLGVPYLH